MDFSVEQIKGVYTEEEAISSSSIREALLKGKIDEANKWLGYYYSVSGTIIEGKEDWPVAWISDCKYQT